MNDKKLFEQARKRVQRKIKGRCVTNKDIIVDQEKEIEYYRTRIRNMMENKGFENKLEVEINDEEYIISYNNNTNAVTMNTYLTKLILEKDKYIIAKDNQFRICNKTRYEKECCFKY